MAIDLSTVVVRDVSANTHTGLRELRNAQPKGVVMHTTIGTNSLSWLQRGSYLAGTPASCDKLFHKNGTIYILTGAHEMSYHAGKSEWLGQFTLEGKWPRQVRTVNRLFLGYEIENLDNGNDVFTAEQYLSAAASYAYDSARYRIRDLNCVHHARVALAAGRKTDPLYWDWGRFWGLVWSIRNDWPASWDVPVWIGR